MARPFARCPELKSDRAGTLAGVRPCCLSGWCANRFDGIFAIGETI